MLQCWLRSGPFSVLKVGISGCFRFWRPLANVPSPASEDLYYFWCNGCGKRHPNEYERFMNSVGECELGPDA
jgi:hypothetical protein